MTAKRKFRLSRRTVSTLTILLLLISGSLLWVFMQSQQKISQAEAETVALVELDYPVKTINNFYWTSNARTQFALDFVDKEGQQRYTIVDQEDGDVAFYTPRDIISSEDAVSIAASEYKIAKLLNVRLGKLKDTVMWEVVFKDDKDNMQYYYINAKDGKWMQTIGNI
ncbi:PepSY domain-containing protein [Ignavigranum ruoffiae]|uniref:PepSY domain-containing protein n=1 Tax=Ignavigranum ruoffiae TaxID=89093 RepID=UPI00235397B6|nr:PepSY domain-containing protein [Ignavigranum ruoffiae]